MSGTRVRNVAKTAAFAVAVLFIGLIAYNLRPQLPDLSRCALARIALPRTYVVARYVWLSEHEILIGGQDQSRFLLLRFDLQSGAYSELTTLSQVFSRMKTAHDGIVDWSMADDASAVVFIGHHSSTCTVVTVDLYGRELTPEGSIVGLRAIQRPIWLPTTKAWLVTGISSNLTVGSVWKSGSAERKLLLYTNIAFPIGVRGESDIFLLEPPQTRSVTGIRLVHDPLEGGNVSFRTRDVRLPFECQVLAARVSPSGRRIVWELRRTSRLPRLRRSATFPFLKFERDPGQSSLWISNSDGDAFCGLGVLPEGRVIGHLLEWHPDETRISMVLGGDFLSVEISKLKCSEP